MKKILVLAAVFSLCFQAISVWAATPDFSGIWELDAGKSTLPAGMSVESIVMKVSQTEKDLRIETTMRARRNDAAEINDNSARINAVAAATQTAVYNLEGGETVSENVGEAAGSKDIRRAAITPDDKLNLNSIRSLKSKTGETATIKINEIWELLDEGKTLKITRYTETPRGATTAELFFTRKTVIGTTQVPIRIGNDTTTKSISGGVLNGKALSLPKPAYPAAARAVRASGAVNVQVTIDEQGNIVSANAVSGHALLRSAAVEAARGAKFEPTLLEGVPVMVTGIIVYNFVP